MKRIKLETLQETAKLKPKGYLVECLRFPAKIEGKWVNIPEHRYSALRLTYLDHKPSFVPKFLSFLQEIGKWKQKGFAITHWRIFLRRSDACSKCPFSVPGLFPTCGRCGCTRAKLFLSTARCPENKWQS
tara:strand:+ start:8801 stop:9190 length:390 start_codon:yes stop_codon:yes gene_type:complete